MNEVLIWDLDWDGPPLVTPLCIECGQLPYMILAGGEQSFCGNLKCDVLIWNATKTRDENLEDSGTIDLSAWVEQ